MSSGSGIRDPQFGTLRIEIMWLRTNGVNTNEGRCKSNEFEQRKQQGTPWHFREDTKRLAEDGPNTSLCHNT